MGAQFCKTRNKKARSIITSFEIVGDAPDVNPDDVIEVADEVSRYDIVAFDRPEAGRLVLRVVRPKSYATFSGTLYQIDRGEEKGTLQLRQLRMQFWPWTESA
jgi:hypothetical protein